MESSETGGNVVDPPIAGVVLKLCRRYTDERGWLIELFRHDELGQENWPRMAYASETLAGVVRGPHEHADQSDYFAFFGPGDFRLYMWDRREDSPTHGNHAVVVVGESNPCTVIVPPGIVHAYKNVSSIPGLVINSPNRLFGGEGRKGPVDEIRHEDDEDSPFQVY